MCQCGMRSIAGGVGAGLAQQITNRNSASRTPLERQSRRGAGPPTSAGRGAARDLELGWVITGTDPA
jgi:hypothetical protein